MNNLLKTVLSIFLFFISINLHADNNYDFVVKSIKVEGINRVSYKTVVDNLGIVTGEKLNPSLTNQSIQSLYDTGYFENIKLYRLDNTLIVSVNELPIISSITFSGNNKVKSEDITKVLQQESINIGNIFNPEVLFKIKQSLLMQYAVMGYYSTEIDVEKKYQDRNRIALKINISEGKKAVIRRINVIGNKNYSQVEVTSQTNFSVPSIFNLWGIFSSKTDYSPTNMQLSLKGLTEFYMDRGYLDFRISSQQASLTPDKENAFIAFNIFEGNPYRISQITFEGTLILSEKELFALLDCKKGEYFSREKVVSSTKKIIEALGNKGYAFANINPIPEMNTDNREVKIIFYIDPGKKTYINEINFIGNVSTNDYVYRRQMQYFESSLYKQSLVDESEIKLQRLPYVENIELKKTLVPGSLDLVDMDYNIKERSANSISFNLGYSQLYNFMIGTNLNIPNVLGTGRTFGIGANLSKVYQNLNLSYTNPFFTQSGISQTINAYLSRTDYDNTSYIANYRLEQYGINLTYGIPTSLFDSVNLGIGIDHTSVLQGSNGRSSVVEWFYSENKGNNAFDTLTVNIGWNHNSTNKAFFPDKGNKLGLNFNAAIPGNELQWYIIKSSAGFFHNILDTVTLSLKGGINYGQGYGKTTYLPFFQNFYGGGWGSVRGFSQGGMGPVDVYIPNGLSPQKGSAIGGNLDIHTNFDILFPVPGVKNSKNMRLGVFFDIGNVYNTKELPSKVLWPEPESPVSPSFANARYSIGIEFQWLSPVGPVAFSLAKPLNVKTGDSTQVFQFTLGQFF